MKQFVIDSLREAIRRRDEIISTLRSQITSKDQRIKVLKAQLEIERKIIAVWDYMFGDDGPTAIAEKNKTLQKESSDDS